MKPRFLALVFFLWTIPVFAQVAEAPLALQLPEGQAAYSLAEDESFILVLSAVGGAGPYVFSVERGLPGASFTDSVLVWTPGHDFVTRLEQEKAVEAVVKVRDASGQEAQRVLRLQVHHTNRPPVVTPTACYALPNEPLRNCAVSATDPDGDPLRFSVDRLTLPEWASFSDSGVLSGRPSHTDWTNLQTTPLTLEVVVSDGTAQVRQPLVVRASTGPVPPSLMILTPGRVGKENQALILQAQVQDLNGLDNVSAVFMDNLPGEATQRYDPASGLYEFRWTPPLTYVTEAEKEKAFTANLIARDRDGLESREAIAFTIADAPDTAELAQLFEQTMQSATGVLLQLDARREGVAAQVESMAKRTRTIEFVNFLIGTLGTTGAMLGIATGADWQKNAGAVMTLASTAITGYQTFFVTPPQNLNVQVQALGSEAVKLESETMTYARKWNTEEARVLSPEVFRADSYALQTLAQNVKASFSFSTGTLPTSDLIRQRFPAYIQH